MVSSKSESIQIAPRSIRGRLRRVAAPADARPGGLGRAAAPARRVAGVERARAEGYRYRPQRGRAGVAQALLACLSEKGEAADALSVLDLRRVHRAALRRQPAGRAARCPGAGRGADAGDRCRVQLLGDDLRPAAGRSRPSGAGADLHAQVRDAVRRPSHGRHGARPGLARPRAGRWRVRAGGAGRPGPGPAAPARWRCRLRRVLGTTSRHAWHALAGRAARGSARARRRGSGDVGRPALRRQLRRAVPAGRARQPARPWHGPRSTREPSCRRVPPACTCSRARPAMPRSTCAPGCSRPPTASPRTPRRAVPRPHWRATSAGGRVWPMAGMRGGSRRVSRWGGRA